MHLKDITKPLESAPIRKGFGKGLLEAGKQNENVVAGCADLTDSTQMTLFKNEFPERFIEIGVAEQNLVTVASGLAHMGKIPYVSSYAAFSPGRNWEQIRTTICLNNVPVKVVGSHAGVSVGPDGATHQMLEDIGLMRVLPNMVVIAPCDSVEAEKATLAMSSHPQPNYLRLAREATPIITTVDTQMCIRDRPITMQKVIPETAVLVPSQAEKVFTGQIFDVYQWQQTLFDNSQAMFEMLKRPDTVFTICIVDGRIVIIERCV